jgi:type IV pilus assembly protein PilE
MSSKSLLSAPLKGLHVNTVVSRRKSSGFTLIELMIVVAIIGVLASIAIPNYTEYVTRSKITEAVSELSSYRVRMEQWFQDNRSYQDTAGTACGATAATGLKYFSLTCSAPTTTTYTVTATATDAALSNLVYTINESNVKETSSVPTGWTLPANNKCWITSKSGTC